MSDLYTSPADLAAQTRARSIDINVIDQAIADAFNKLPNEAELKRGLINYATTEGAADAYTITLAYPPLAYVDGMVITAKIHAPNTVAGAVINVNGLGNVGVKLANGNPIAAGDLQGITELRYNVSLNAFQLSSSLAAVGTTAIAAATATAAAQSASADAAASNASKISAAASAQAAASAAASLVVPPFVYFAEGVI